MIPEANGVKKVAKKRESNVTNATAAPTTKRKLDSVVGDRDQLEKAGEPKRRKQKGRAEENTMPLAERTSVASLKKAMYIGAHVSAAGGECVLVDTAECARILRSELIACFNRRSKFRLQCRTDWGQLICPVPQVSTQMGQPSLILGGTGFIPQWLQESRL
jgi:AP endonuclease-1